ncbi:hypothetical protein TNIN_273781 [Trichonephila inaurata madagascariensis]|uniref:Uncharacterized protein n=1 Tax=Trichonephila inaurata madagascariensis TaxID=2747483 RepID=A0A8X6YUR1_9ARAC|nr:hypothetical protein TNIN_273781 [Trichonephila inaurata madagascariensis]
MAACWRKRVVTPDEIEEILTNKESGDEFSDANSDDDSRKNLQKTRAYIHLSWMKKKILDGGFFKEPHYRGASTVTEQNSLSIVSDIQTTIWPSYVLFPTIVFNRIRDQTCCLILHYKDGL